MLKEIEELITPRIITCVGGAYPGGRAHALDVPAAKDVIGITRSNACIIHIPPSPDRFPATCIPIVDLLAAFHTPEHVVPLLNTSRAATSKEALWMIDHGLAQFEEGMFGYEPLIKLEILDQDLRPVHEEVLRCLASLSPRLIARTIPYIQPDSGVMERVCQLGCPAVRVSAGRIGQKTGVLDTALVRKAIDAAGNIPIILEGGLDSGHDIEVSADLGAACVLVNSAFVLARDPREKALELREAADRAWGDLRGSAQVV